MSRCTPNFVAYHEAGHAAMALHVGRGVELATIIRDGDILGQVRMSPLGTVPDAAYWASTAIAIDLAGPIAEWRSMYYPGRRSLGSRARSRLHEVLHEVLQSLKALPGEKVPGDFRLARIVWQDGSSYHFWRIWCEIFKTLDNLWPVVTRLARALETHRSLSGTLVQRIAEHRDTAAPLPAPVEQLPLWPIGGAK